MDENTNAVVNTNTTVVNGNTNVTVNSNGNLNTNTVVLNTNTAVNLNTNTSTIKYPGQEWPGLTDNSVLYQKYSSTASDEKVYTVQPGQQPSVYFTIPTGYSLVSNESGRLIWLEKDNYLYIYDIQKGSTRKTSLPALIAGEVRFESARPTVYSTDGVEVIIQYSLFDKNSAAYNSEFAGPNPISTKRYRYNITTNTYTPGENMSGIFYSLWDRKLNIGYNHLAGEGVGSKAPIEKTFFDTGNTEDSADYGNNSTPAFSQDGKWVAVPEPSKAPLKIYIFSLPDIKNPVKTLTLPTVKDTPPVTNTLGYIYDFEWTTDDQNLILSFNHSIFVINVQTEKATKVFDNTQNDSSYTGWSYYPEISGSNRYIYFVDYSNSNPATLKPENNIDELKAYDITTGKTTILLKTTGETNIQLIGFDNF
ncbi:MAG: hypothetical protein WC270_03065 [Patescibacteria group bacterium]